MNPLFHFIVGASLMSTVLVMALFTSVYFAHAASDDDRRGLAIVDNSGQGTQAVDSTNQGTEQVDNSGRGKSGKLDNPLDSSISSIPAFFLAILDILLVFAIPFVVFFIMYAGFLYVTARGNASVIEQAHKALLYAIIGGLLIFGARAILDIITNTVDSVTWLPVETIIKTS